MGIKSTEQAAPASRWKHASKTPSPQLPSPPRTGATRSQLARWAPTHTLISRYLNTKEEINLKRILWEAMNGTCTKAKKQKRITQAKTVKKVAITNEKSGVEGRSSKINFDALKNLYDELGQDSETAEVIRADSCVNSPDESISHEYSKSSYREEDECDYSEDYQTFDQHLTDEYLDFW